MHRSDLINIDERFIKEAEGYEGLYVGRVSSQERKRDWKSVHKEDDKEILTVFGTVRY